MARNIEELINRQIHRWNSISTLLKQQAASSGEEDIEWHAAETQRRVHPIICISRQMGSGARDIARLLCRRLNYELFGSEIINQIAQDLNVQRRLIESLDEHRRGELQFMFDSFLSGREIELTDFARSLTRVVTALSLQGGVVLLGRGANYILKSQAALSVRVVAPRHERIERIQRYLNLSPENARRKVDEIDRDRAEFIRHFFHADVDDPCNFDLIINTSRMSTAASTELIIAALRVRGFTPEQLAMPS